ncbi:MAG: hypothetical protein JSU00_14770 [Acidobacteria bacterium]|nr:hypothetical protein [Acidobacteriota bacterium]
MGENRHLVLERLSVAEMSVEQFRKQNILHVFGAQFDNQPDGARRPKVSMGLTGRNQFKERKVEDEIVESRGAAPFRPGSWTQTLANRIPRFGPGLFREPGCPWIKDVDFGGVSGLRGNRDSRDCTGAACLPQARKSGRDLNFQSAGVRLLRQGNNLPDGSGEFRIQIARNPVQARLKAVSQPVAFGCADLANPAVLQNGEDSAQRQHRHHERERPHGFAPLSG